MADDGASLVTRLTGNIDDFKEKMGQATTIARTTAKQIQAEFTAANPKLNLKELIPTFESNRAGRAIQSVIRDVQQLTGMVPVMTSTFSSFGVAGVVAATAIGGAFATARAAMDFGAQIQDTAQKIGITTDEVQKFHFAALKTGTSIDAMDSALVAFNRNLSLAASNAPRSLQGFQLLFGKDFKAPDAKALLDSGDAFQKVAKAFSALNVQGQTAVASKLGLEGIRPFLDEIGDGLKGNKDLLKEFFQEAQDGGFVLDSSIIERSAELQHQWDILVQTVKVEMYDAIFNLEPALVWFLGKIQEIAQAVGGIISAFQTIDKLSLQQLQRNQIQNDVRINQLRAQGVAPKPLTAADRARVPATAGEAFQNFVPGVARSIFDPNPHIGDIINALRGKDTGSKNIPVSPLGTFDQHGNRVSALAPGQELTHRLELQQQINAQEAIRTKQNADANARLAGKGAPGGGADPHVLPSHERKGPKDHSDEQLARFNQQEAAIARERLNVKNNEFATTEERAAIELQILEEQRKEKKFQILKQAASDGLTDAQAQQLVVENDTLFNEKADLQKRINLNKIRDEQLDVQKQILEANIELLNGNTDDVTASETFAKQRDNARNQFLQSLQENADIANDPKAIQQLTDAFDSKQARELADQQLDGQKAIVEAQQGLLKAEQDLSLTRKQRAELELKSFDVETEIFKAEQERLKNERIRQGISPDLANQAQALNLQGRDLQRQNVIDNNRGPLFQEFKSNASDLDDALQKTAVNGIHSLIDGLATASEDAKSLGDVVRDVFKQMAQDAIKFLLQSVENDLLGAVFKGGDKKGGGLGGILGSIFGGLFGGSKGGGGVGGAASGLFSIAAGSLPAFANGTTDAPGGLSIVGEKGPELLNLQKGSQIIPNNMLSSLVNSGQKGITFDLRGAVVTEDLLQQMNDISLRNSAMSVQFSKNITKADLSRQARRSLG